MVIVNLNKYQILLKTVELGSITRAAEALGYTQSAVSRVIADLEREWDMELLTRSRTGVVLSSSGAALLPYVQAVCNAGRELEEQVAERVLIKLGEFEAKTFDQLNDRFCSTAGSDQVIDNNHLLSRSNRILVHLDLCGAVFQGIFGRNSFTWQFALFANRNKSLVLCIGNRHTKDKSSGFRTCYYIKIQIFNQILHGINCKMKSVCIL